MKILMLLLMFISTSAFADVSGQWIGWGEWLYQGQGANCPTMSIGFSESPSEFRRLGGTFDCEVVVLHSDPLSWERRGDDLFLNGIAAGRITPDGFETTEPYNDEGTMVHTKMKREGNHADYEERWVSANGNEIYLITARLFFRERP